MVITNKQRVENALNLLREDLYPFVESKMHSVYQDKWVDIAKSSIKTQKPCLRSEVHKIIQEDVSTLFSIIKNQWNDVFGQNLDRAEQNLVHELLTIRNQWAHNSSFSLDDAYRAVDSIYRLLLAISPSQAEIVKEQRQEILDLISKQQTQQKTSDRSHEDDTKIDFDSLTKPDFIVVDTEGKKELTEITIIDSQGQLIYEAFTKEHPNSHGLKGQVKPLSEIIKKFIQLSQDKLIICHNANHDKKVLENSCNKAGIKWQELNFKCTLELAQEYFKNLNLSSYSLEHLSKSLHLKVERQFFNLQQAHASRYDAQFTYQLYLKILKQKTIKNLKNKPNPFGSSRVDNPFQHHADRKSIYQLEFEKIKSVITDIKHDKNHQSQGLVVIGEPGTGKTHLMMRLAEELLKVNRLLFIRQPNHSDTVIYHTYCRILESFLETVPDRDCEYTQIEYLLANSFVKLINTTKNLKLTTKDREILDATQKNSLDLYKSLGGEGTATKRQYWERIENMADKWWVDRYGFAGYSRQILKGIIKFCSYIDRTKKDLVTRWLAVNELTEEELNEIGLNNWKEEMSKEEFSLQAISVFSKLSLLDEPLIIIFDQLEGLSRKHNQELLLSFGESIKEIFTHVPNSLIILNLFPDRWQHFQTIFDGSIVDRVSQNQVDLEKPNDEEIKEILNLKAKSVGIKTEDLFTDEEIKEILSHNSIRAVINSAANYYRYKVDNIPLPKSVEIDRELETNQTVLQRLEALENQLSQLQHIIHALDLTGEFVSDPSKQTCEEDLDNSDNRDESKTLPSINVDLEAKEQVINYLELQEKSLLKEYERLQIITDSDDIGKVMTIAETFKSISNFKIDYLRLGKKTLPEHIAIDNKVIGFLHTDGNPFTARIRNFNELVITNKTTKFQLWRDVRKPDLTAKGAKEEIAKLKNASNGNFAILDKSDRIRFELLYKMITDLQNRDLEIDLKIAIEVASVYFKDDWLIKLFSSI